MSGLLRVSQSLSSEVESHLIQSTYVTKIKSESPSDLFHMEACPSAQSGRIAIMVHLNKLLSKRRS